MVGQDEPSGPAKRNRTLTDKMKKLNEEKEAKDRDAKAKKKMGSGGGPASRRERESQQEAGPGKKSGGGRTLGRKSQREDGCMADEQAKRKCSGILGPGRPGPSPATNGDDAGAERQDPHGEYEGASTMEESASSNPRTADQSPLGDLAFSTIRLRRNGREHPRREHS